VGAAAAFGGHGVVVPVRLTHDMIGRLARQRID